MLSLCRFPPEYVCSLTLVIQNYHVFSGFCMGRVGDAFSVITVSFIDIDGAAACGETV